MARQAPTLPLFLGDAPLLKQLARAHSIPPSAWPSETATSSAAPSPQI